MLQLFGKKPPKNVLTRTFKIGGLHCTACALNVDGALEDVPGVVKAATKYASSEVQVTYNPDVVSVTQIKQAVEAVGYQVLE